MARKNKRARANYLRKDYRKGGRVRLHEGSHSRKDERTREEKELGDPPYYDWSPHNPSDPGHNVPVDVKTKTKPNTNTNTNTTNTNTNTNTTNTNLTNTNTNVAPYRKTTTSPIAPGTEENEDGNISPVKDEETGKITLGRTGAGQPIFVDPITGSSVMPTDPSYSNYSVDSAGNQITLEGVSPRGDRKLFDVERRQRVTETGRSATDIASGSLPEGTVPTTEVEKISQEGTTVGTIGMTGDTSITGQTMGRTTPESVTTMTDIGQARDPNQLQTAKMTAALVSQAPEIEGIIGELSPEAIARVDEIRNLSGPAEAAKISKAAVDSAKATTVDAIISTGAYVPQVSGIAGQVSDTPDAELQTRTAITGQAATGEAAQIINTLGFEAAQRSSVQGTARSGAAATMIAETSAIPEDIAAAIVEDPATMEAQIGTEDVTVQAAVAALPTEALMSAQMESLVGGLESGNIPAWAKPAVAQVTQMMAERGLDVSTVARDALFNSIIQSALPIAQNNAQALQTRAAQNLSNQQQANLTEAQQEQQLRMQNLANRQGAASQTAQMAQQMGVQQGQFRQEAVMASAAQQQQTRVQNLQNRQYATALNAQNQQAMAVQNLNVGVQTDLANLQILNETERENMSADQQGRLLEYQTASEFMTQNAAFTQDMRKANLSSEQQIQLANLTALNQASSENLNAAQQTELTNLNKRMQMNLQNAELAQQMGVAQLNVDQQRAMQNATMVANMDMSKFTTAQQVKLANSQWMQSATTANLSAEQQAILQNATALASLDMATLDQRTRISAQNAQSFLAMDMSNLSNAQQAEMLMGQQEQQKLLSNQSATNAARQINAASENQTNQFMQNLSAQIDQFNVQNLNASRQFNVQQVNAAEMRRAGLEFEENKANAAILNRVSEFNSQMDYNREQWNAQNEQAVEISNTTWRRQSNTADTAAQNAVNQQNSQNAFSLTSAAQAFLWQELRDQADYDFKFADNEATRKVQALIAASSNESNSAATWSTNYNNISGIFDKMWAGT